MSNVEDRLDASLRYDAIHGDSMEISVLETQIKEAVDELRRLRYLEKENAELRAKVEELEGRYDC